MQVLTIDEQQIMKEFVNLYIDDEFGADVESSDYETESIASVMEQVCGRCVWGASKFVVIPAEGDYVIKIPFTGEFNWNDSTEQLDFCPFMNDYCEIERNRYEELKSQDIGVFFAETRLLGSTKYGKKIYVQEKIKETFYDSAKRSFSKDSYDIVQDIHSKTNRLFLPFDDEWIAIAIDYYGEKVTKKLLDYAEENIYDLHHNNYGYRYDGSPVIHDFSDFNE